jgi:hypothetical protein
VSDVIMIVQALKYFKFTPYKTELEKNPVSVSYGAYLSIWLKTRPNIPKHEKVVLVTLTRERDSQRREQEALIQCSVRSRRFLTEISQVVSRNLDFWMGSSLSLTRSVSVSTFVE